MTMFEKIKSMDIDKFAEWLEENCDFDSALWWEWWDKNYCKKCEPINLEISNSFGHKTECDYAYCELNDNCKFFKDMDDIPDRKQTIKMWLESEYE